MAFIDYYKILGVKKDIPQKDVRAAYRKRAKQFTPTFTLTIRKQRRSSRHCQKPTK